MTDVQHAFYRLAPHIVDLAVDDDGTRAFAGRRFVFFQTKLFAHLFEDMREVTGPVVDSLIQNFGEQAGHDIASKMDAQFRDSGLLAAVKLLVASRFDWRALNAIRPTDTETMIEKIFGLGIFDGWIGDVTIEAYDEAERTMRVRAENTFESYSYGDTGETQCAFLQGVLKGMLTYYWEEDGLVVQEEACRCAGDDACLMVVTHEA